METVEIVKNVKIKKFKDLEAIRMLDKFGFKYFYDVEIIKTDYFADSGNMDWLVKYDFVLAAQYPLFEKRSGDIFIPRVKSSKEVLKNDSIEKEWPLKIGKKLILPARSDSMYEDIIPKNLLVEIFDNSISYFFKEINNDLYENRLQTSVKLLWALERRHNVKLIKEYKKKSLQFLLHETYFKKYVNLVY